MRASSHVNLAACVALAMLTAHCGRGAIFAGRSESHAKSGTQPGVTPEQANGAGTPAQDAASPADGGKAADLGGGEAAKNDAAALKSCLDGWKDNPFGPDAAASATIVPVNYGIANGAVLYRDENATAEPKLILLDLNGKNANQAKLELRNPQGWYCVALNGQALNGLQVNLGCTSHLASFDKATHVSNNLAYNRPGC